jgi:hypothetical protein
MGCKECEIVGCPMESITEETIECADMWDMLINHGLTPVAGGLLDQCAVFLEGMKFYRSCRSLNLKAIADAR